MKYTEILKAIYLGSEPVSKSFNHLLFIVDPKDHDFQKYSIIFQIYYTDLELWIIIKKKFLIVSSMSNNISILSLKHVAFNGSRN